MLIKMRNILLFSCIFAFSVTLCTSSVYAEWLYSSKTGKWINLDKKVKKTPKEQFDYAKSLEEKKDYKDALDEYNNFLYNFASSPLEAEVCYRMGICYEELQDYHRAYKMYQRIIDVHLSYENIRAVIERQYKIGNLFMSGERKKVFGFIPSMTSPLTIAEEIYEGIIKNATYNEFAVMAVYKLGEIKIRKKDYKAAIDIYRKVISDYKNDKYTEAATYKMAYCKYMLSKESSYEQKSTLEAIKGFMDFLKKYGEGEFAKEAIEKVNELKERYSASLMEKARFYKKQDRIDSALIYYEAVANEFSDTKYAKEASEEIKILKQNIDEGTGND